MKEQNCEHYCNHVTSNITFNIRMKNKMGLSLRITEIIWIQCFSVDLIFNTYSPLPQDLGQKMGNQ